MQVSATGNTNESAAQEPGQLATLASRLIQSITLRRETFAEVALDPSTARVAIAVVLLAALGTAVGTFSDGGLGGVPGRVVVTFASWFAWTAAVVALPKLFTKNASVDWGTAGRVMALAHAPLVLRGLNALTSADILLALTVLVWHVAASYVAIRAIYPNISRPASWMTVGVGFVGATFLTGFAGLLFLG